jgi:hypothetical protein
VRPTKIFRDTLQEAVDRDFVPESGFRRCTAAGDVGFCEHDPPLQGRRSTRNSFSANQHLDCMHTWYLCRLEGVHAQSGYAAGFNLSPSR